MDKTQLKAKLLEEGFEAEHFDESQPSTPWNNPNFVRRTCQRKF
jgi:hypothetical protein